MAGQRAAAILTCAQHRLVGKHAALPILSSHTAGGTRQAGKARASPPEGLVPAAGADFALGLARQRLVLARGAALTHTASRCLITRAFELARTAFVACRRQLCNEAWVRAEPLDTGMRQLVLEVLQVDPRRERCGEHRECHDGEHPSSVRAHHPSLRLTATLPLAVLWRR